MAEDTCLSNVSRLSMRTPRLHTHLEIQKPGRNYLNSDLSDGPRWRLRVLSHLPHLVVLNRTRVGFRSCYGSFGPVRTQQSHSVCTKSGPNKRTETFLKRWSRHIFKRTLERFIRPQTDPTAKRTAHFWAKPAAIVSCAVHYGMRKCL